MDTLLWLGNMGYTDYIDFGSSIVCWWRQNLTGRARDNTCQSEEDLVGWYWGRYEVSARIERIDHTEGKSWDSWLAQIHLENRCQNSDYYTTVIKQMSLHMCCCFCCKYWL